MTAYEYLLLYVGTVMKNAMKLNIHLLVYMVRKRPIWTKTIVLLPV